MGGDSLTVARPTHPLIPEVLARERSWPKSARALSGKLRRAAPPLRKIGIHVDFIREGHDRERLIVITTGSKGIDSFASASSAEPKKPEKPNNVNELGADANADRMRTQTSDADANDADANADSADGTRTQAGNGPPADNHRKNNSFSESADDADSADANSATSPPPGAVFAKVEIREVWPPALGPPGDDVFDIDPEWRR
jgi:hypothetical protein